MLTCWMFILQQISELYELVKKWETTAEILPQVVDRLLSLKELHEQGNCSKVWYLKDS